MWIFSHSHGDHVGSTNTYDMVTTFKFYKGEVTVMYNKKLSTWIQSGILM